MSTPKFSDLNLAPKLLSVLEDLGYETPTPVQAQSIPVLLNGRDILAQAQTGTGKTAAFALPILSQIDLSLMAPQALVIAPTRELAIQVAEAFQTYAKPLKGFQVTPIYGGQDYPTQLRALKRGSHVIVGTPGRVMDHLRRGTLSTSALKVLVLDEADEMLKMGFIDDVEWILEQIQQDHQTALFSATLPASIQQIAKRYLNDAEKIKIKPQKDTVGNIEQTYMRVANNQKLDALTRYLEVENVQASIIFARTKNASAELAEKLQARGYAAAALNGDMNQSLRKKVIDRIKSGSLDIVVATDVAARGIDIDRISHVINFDISHDVESYIHRIGRTGRAGRKGKALLLVTPRERRLFTDIERTVGVIKEIQPPSAREMGVIRNKQLAEKIRGVIAKSKKLEAYRDMVASIMEQMNCEPTEVAAALAYLLQQDTNPLPEHDIQAPRDDFEGDRRHRRGGGRGSNSRPPRFKKKSFSGSNSEKSGKRRSAYGEKSGAGKPGRSGNSGKKRFAKKQK